MTKQEKTKRKFSIYTLIQIIGVLMIVVAASYLIYIFYGYYSSQKEYDAIEKVVFEDVDVTDDATVDETEENNRKIQENLIRLQEEYPDVVGWIRFDDQDSDMDISYPIMQTTDNDYYLTHTYSGETNSSGSIFLEKSNADDFEDAHTIIYGHNMRDLSMFGKLKNYKKDGFYEAHPTFTIYTATEVYHYEIFAYYDVSERDSLYTVGYNHGKEFEDFINNMVSRSYADTGVSVDRKDLVVTLSTCSSTGRRFVLNAKRVDD